MIDAVDVKETKIILPGAAGLVGQNLIITLKEKGYQNIVAIDKHSYNIRILKTIHPDITVIEADLSESGDWQETFLDGDVIIMLQAQIGSGRTDLFIRNNINATETILKTAKEYNVPYILHISSSVVESVSDDDYTNTKRQQEQLVINSGISYCILRPTLMFGWFDRKHLGWLSRFLQKSPVFPIPGNGLYMRQPLYVKDFCNIIVSCIKSWPVKQICNITGRENVDYVKIIKTIRKETGARCIILYIPYWLFWGLLKLYAVFDSDPPFTTDQLHALIAEDEFELIPWWEIFNVTPTHFEDAVRETFCDKKYSEYVLEF